MAATISQELFDETILENEECFDLPPNEALRETIDQFCQQLGHSTRIVIGQHDHVNDDAVNDGSNDNNDATTLLQSIPAAMAHLTLTHPSDPQGQIERMDRTKFYQCLSLLDDCVGTDGVVVLPPSVTTSATTTAAAVAKVNQEVMKALSHISNKLQSSSNNEEDPLPYLIIFQQSCSIYTLLSFLTTIIPLNDNTTNTNGDSANGGNEEQSLIQHQQQQQDKLQLLQQTIQTLTSLLTTVSAKDNVKCAQIRGELRDLFIVGLNRLVILLMKLVMVVNVGATKEMSSLVHDNDDGDNDGGALENGTGNTNNSSSLKKLQKTLLLNLLKLSISAVKGCEGGKVAFVQSTLLDQENNNDTTTTTTTTTTKVNTKRGGVNVIYTILCTTPLFSNDKDSTSASTTTTAVSTTASTTLANMEIIEATCRLLTTLCRYDDFRTPSTTSNGAAAAAGGVSTSSAHDHAMEFHRVGIERLLVKVANWVLNDLELVYGEEVGGGDVDGGSSTAVNVEQEDEGGVLLAKKELLAAAVLTALRVLAVNDEIIQTMVALGVLPIVTKALRLSVTTTTAVTTNTDDEEGSATRSNHLVRKHRLAAGALGLIRNLCGNDEIKTNLCLGSSNNNDDLQSSSLSISSTPSALPHLLRAMQLYPTISPIQEHACGTLAAMALRRPSNARAIIEEGSGPRLIITAMKRHTENVSVQRQGALAVRNIVSRLLRDLDGGSSGGGGDGGDDNTAASKGNTAAEEDARSAIRDRFAELGAEDVLRNIAGRHQGSVDEAYAALRDLGYSVTLTKFSAEDLKEGNVSSSNAIGRTMMFGEKHNSNFRPVYEQSAGLSNAVDEAVSNFGA
jgi:hypothetical protein